MSRILAAVLVVAASLPAAGAALDESDFYVRSAQDLVDLCAPDPGSPLAEEAIHFCHGFASGAWQYHEAQAAGPEGKRIVCLRDTGMTRNEAVAQFVAWARAHPEHMGEPGVEALFRFLHEKAPCPEPAATEGSR